MITDDTRRHKTGTMISVLPERFWLVISTESQLYGKKQL